MFFYVILFLLALLIYFLFVKPFNYWKDRGIKHEKPMFFFGNMWKNAIRQKSISEVLLRVYNNGKRNRFYGWFIYTRPVLIINDLDLIKQIGIKEIDTFTDHQIFADDTVDSLWSKNLLNSNGAHWKKSRNILSPAFTGSKMHAMYSLMAECSDQLMKHLNSKDVNVKDIDMRDAFYRYANDVIATCAFGVKCDSLKEPKNEFFLKGLQATNFVGLKALKFILLQMCPALMKVFSIKIFDEPVGNFFRTLLKDTIAYRMKHGVVRPDMIHLLMEARKSCDEKTVNAILSDEDITAHALIFFFAGFDTSANLMAFMAYELAINVDVQVKLRAEVDAMSELCKDRNLEYTDLMSMKYLDMVVAETLRKYPITPATDRINNKDFVIEPKTPGEEATVLKKGTVVWFPMIAIQNDPDVFPEPQRFDPERFNEENKKNIHPAAYMPFGIGPRLCIGSRFALMETKILFYKLIRNFEIIPIEATHIPMITGKLNFNIQPKDMRLGLKKRI